MFFQSLIFLLSLTGFFLPAPLLAKTKTPKAPEFFVVIPSYNNIKWCEKNLESVFCQTYTNWSIYYVNDCSKDGTGECVENYIKKRGMEKKCTVIHNSTNLGAMANLYNAIHQADPRKVVVILDGDDCLFGNDVFQTLADIYADPDVWHTYGSFVYEPGGGRGICEEIPRSVLKEGSIRSYKWVASHLRTFYAALFQKIKKEDLMVNGKFFEITYDFAVEFPIVEMAQKHTRYVDKILLLYNVANPISDSTRADFQYKTGIYIRSLKPYRPLKKLF